jgi:hypothetical protein
MTQPTRPRAFQPSAHRKAETLAAALLISAGVVFEWLEISYRHANIENLWYISLAVKTLWRMAEFCLNTPALHDALQLAPLALLAAGIVMLVSAKRAASSRPANGEQNG